MRRTLTIIDAFNAHVHFREGQMLKDIIGYTANLCGAGVAMGNLKQPVDDLERLLKYRDEILMAAKAYPMFHPVMTIMLTLRTTPETIRLCAPYARVLKFIPAATSTNAQPGVALEDLDKYDAVFEEMIRQGMIFSIHAERIRDDDGNEIPESERERAALPFVQKLINRFPELKIIIEHLSTRESCELVMTSSNNVAGTITAHHPCFSDNLLYDRDGKIQPEYYCKPVLKSEADRAAVEQAMLSGYPNLFYGSDSAAHPENKKFGVTTPAAGIFSEPVAISLIAEKFNQAGLISRLENFLSINGRLFYDLPIPAKKTLRIIEDENLWRVPKTVGVDKVPVLMGGQWLGWRVKPKKNFLYNLVV